MKKKFLTPMLYIISGVLVVAGILLVILWSTHREETLPAETIPSALTQDPDVTIVYRDVDRLVEVEKEITASIIQDGLNDLGTLITQEYYFTEVVSFSSVKQLFGLDLNFTESSYIGTYDGTVTAGMDFRNVRIEKDDDAQTVTVYLPACSIQNIDIDPNSFVLYDESSGLGNPVSVTDFNRSLIELENNASAKAMEKGILEKADENAQFMIRSFISGLIDLSVYSVTFVTE